MKGPHRLAVGLYGINGHQIHRRLQSHPLARLAACCHFDPPPLAGDHPDRPRLRICGSLDEILRTGP